MNVLCRVLGVSVDGYRSWRRRPPCHRVQQDEQLSARIKSIHARSKGRYGTPRVHAELQAHGERCGRKRVARLMRQAGLFGRGPRRFVRTTDSEHALPVAENLVQRNFNPPQPDQVWAADLTFIPTKEGWLYLAIVLDLYARLVVGWAMDERMPTELPLAALSMALRRRSPPAGLVHHSDRGSQYAACRYQEVLSRHGLVPSMSRKGNCWDNAVVESFFASLKRELLDGKVFEDRPTARAAIFEYVEVFYNRQRRHSSLGYLTPSEADRQAQAA